MSHLKKQGKLDEEINTFILEKFYSVCLKTLTNNYKINDLRENHELMNNCHFKLLHAYNLANKFKKKSETQNEEEGDL